MNLLFVDARLSPRGPESRTLRLSNAFLDAFKEAHPGDDITVVNPSELCLQPLDQKALMERDALAQAGDFSAPVFQLARQFQSADKIVVAAPFWDLSFPAILRVYIEHISVCGLCYHYDFDGCHGDCKASRLAYLSTGGDFQKPVSLGIEYWRQIAEMFGIPQFDYVFANGLDIDPGKEAEIMAPALEQARILGRDF